MKPPAPPLTQAEQIALLHRSAPARAGEAALAVFLRPARTVPNPRQRTILNRAQQSTITVANHEIRTYTWGRDKTAPTVVLAHGFGMHAGAMADFVQPLIDLGFRVVAFDQAAHGASDGEVGNLGIFALSVRRLLQDYAPVAGLIGHSVGATTALMALAADDQPTLPRLACLSPPLQSRTLFTVFARTRGLPLEIVDDMLKARVEKRIVSPETVSDKHIPGRIKSATLVMHDRDDHVIPMSDGERLAELLPSAQFEATQGLSHAKGLSDAGVIKRVTDFMAEALPHLEPQSATLRRSDADRPVEGISTPKTPVSA